MKKKYWLFAALVAAVLIWLMAAYYMVDWRLYPKEAAALDLRGQNIRPAHYEKVKKKMPLTRIRWDIPFQGGLLTDDTVEVTVTELSAEDAKLLEKYLPDLRIVNAEGCTDYENLLYLAGRRPDVQVNYRVDLDGKPYSGAVRQLTVSSIEEAEVGLLAYLPNLKTVIVTGGEAKHLQKLQEYCTEHTIAIKLQFFEKQIRETAVRATISGITDDQLGMLHLLKNLQKLHLPEPEAQAQNLLQLQQTLSDVAVTWEKSVLGIPFPWDAEEIDLTAAVALGEGEAPGTKTAYQYGRDFPVQGTQEQIPTAVKISTKHPLPDKTAVTGDLIDKVESAMDYFPRAKKLVMVGSVLDNEQMSDFREAHRESYKVVWSVKCGRVLTRSDADFFMPVKYHVYYLNNEEAYNLRYCEELVAVDIGHMNVSDISFVEYLPNLQYLILAHTSVQYIEPIRSCKKLKFLELDWSGIRDVSPLVDCTGLEDLNVGNTGADLSPLKEMTWLKNLWMIFRGNSAYPLTKALPDTRVVAAGNATVASGWRDLPNYFAMRDRLKMYYMSW